MVCTVCVQDGSIRSLSTDVGGEGRPALQTANRVGCACVGSDSRAPSLTSIQAEALCSDHDASLYLDVVAAPQHSHQRVVQRQ